MKIAVPVKTNKEDTAVSPLFGKAKWFAFAEDGKITIEKNEAEGGIRVIDWLLENNVEALIVQHIGHSPYEMLKGYDEITLFYAGEGRVPLHEAIEKFEKDELVIIDDTNADTLVGHH